MKQLFYGLLLIFTIALASCGEKKECTIVVLDWPAEIARCITAEEERGLRDGSKAWNEVWDRLKRDCPNVEMHDNGAALAALHTYPEAILVTGKADMMNKVKQRAEREKCCIKKLIIRGHGTDGKISVGDGQRTETCKYINGDPNGGDYNKDDWKRDLADLKGLLCKDAEILLEGCGVGHGDVGRFKLEEIAKEFGVTVTAPTIEINAGQKIVDIGDSVRRVTPPAEVRPPAAGAAAESNKQKKEDKKKKSTAGEKPFAKEVTAIGFYPSRYMEVPDITTSPALPITDMEWISAFINEIDTTAAYDATLQGYEVDATIIVRYADSTYQFAYTLHGNLMFGINVKGRDLQFSLTERGTAMVQEGIGSTTGGRR